MSRDYASSLAQIATLLYSIKNEEQMAGFLEDILTPQVVEIAERMNF